MTKSCIYESVLLATVHLPMASGEIDSRLMAKIKLTNDNVEGLFNQFMKIKSFWAKNSCTEKDVVRFCRRKRLITSYQLGYSFQT